jgi:hypothetical protein
MGVARKSVEGATAGAGGTGAVITGGRQVAALLLVGALVADAFVAARCAGMGDAFAFAGAFPVAVAPEVATAGGPAGTACKAGADAAGLGAAVRLGWRPVASASAFVWSEEIARRSSDSAVAVRALG